MLPLSKALWSSVGKKILMAITGLAMFIFLVEHLSANFLLFSENSAPYNQYTDFLLNFGKIIVVAEFILIAILAVHMCSAIFITLGKWKARPVSYSKNANAGGPSKKTFSSSNMIWTGALIFIFLAIHLKNFKYGSPETVTVDGVIMLDMHGLVMKVFKEPLYAWGYILLLSTIFFHLRHGFWSAFQSLGAYHPRYMPIIYAVGIILAIVLAVGFISIPLWILYF